MSSFFERCQKNTTFLILVFLILVFVRSSQKWLSENELEPFTAHGKNEIYRCIFTKYLVIEITANLLFVI